MCLHLCVCCVCVRSWLWSAVCVCVCVHVLVHICVCMAGHTYVQSVCLYVCAVSIYLQWLILHTVVTVLSHK